MDACEDHMCMIHKIRQEGLFLRYSSSPAAEEIDENPKIIHEDLMELIKIIQNQ